MDTEKQLQEYEKLFETDPVTALKKMVDLFPLVEEASDFNSIELWMENEGSKEIIAYILEKIQQDEKNKKLYEMLLNTITE